MRAIVIKKNLFSEGNEIITFYTRENGKVRAVARAVKSAKSKLAFGLENLFYSDIELSPSKKLAVITGVRAASTFKNIRTDLEKVYLALHASEIILKSTVDEEPNSELFDLFLEFLTYLDSVPSRPAYYSMDVFTLKALGAIGYKPEFIRCAVCGKDLAVLFNSDNEEQVFFSNHKGGILCGQDAQHSSDARQLNPEVYRFLLNYGTIGFIQADQQDLPADQLHSLAEGFAKYILERDLNTGKYL